MKLAYKTYGKSSNTPIVFLHGFLGSSKDWGDVVTFLSEKYFCITVDLPGHGESISEIDEDYSFEKSCESIVFLLKELSINNSDLVGYSMGGRIAYYLAVNYGNLFNKIIIESATPGLKIKKEQDQRKFLDKLLANRLQMEEMKDFLTDWYNLPLFSTMDKQSDSFELLLKRRLKNDPKGLAKSLLHSGTGSMPSLWDQLGRIKNNLFLIAGKLDSKFVQTSEEVKMNCNGSELFVVENAGHNVHFEQPDRYIKIIEEILNK